MQKIIPNLWFNSQAEEAAHFYTSTFANSRIGDITRYDAPSAEVSGQPEGSVLTIEFELMGYAFLGLNGGPAFEFTPAVSFLVALDSKEKVNELWEKLRDGGSVLMPVDEYPFSDRYGWLKDKYGVSWQIMLYPGEIQQTITPTLMFVGDVCGKAEEAMELYTSVFHNAHIDTIMRYEPGEEPDKEGTIKHAGFTIEGQGFAAMDSAQEHDFTFTEAVSFIVNCETQEELDHYWNKLSAVPEAEQCGWMKDKYGVSWQITPIMLYKLLADPDPVKAQRVMKAMLQMHKLDIAKLQEAYDNK